MGPGRRVAAGHDGGPAAGALFTARHARADEQEALFSQSPGAADGVREVGVAAVDDDVALFEEGNQLVDELVDRGAGLDHEHDAPGALEA